MSQYPVVWDEKTRTFTLRDETDRPAKEAVTHVYAPVLGEIPDPASHPQVAQHLQNMARTMNVDWRFVSVKNNTKNKRLDLVVKKGDKFEPEAELGDEAGETEIAEPTADTQAPVLGQEFESDKEPTLEAKAVEPDKVESNTSADAPLEAAGKAKKTTPTKA
jgi:hypothetical protein